MRNRREFLGGCVGTALAMALPASGALFGTVRAAGIIDAYARDAFEALKGKRIDLREGGSVVVAGVETVEADRRCEQFVVQVEPSTAMGSGLYHLEAADGTRALYLEAGGAGRRTMSAAVSRLRA